ncbi:MAG: S-layer homology domain-containing protein [Clostridia bacterium]|nr:S-layer homology domain-containing protein [Clostridia bacterium]
MQPIEADKPISTDKPSDNWFTDVPENAWYYNSVKYVFENGLILGVSDTEFKPLENITREQTAAIVYRYSKFKEYDTDINGGLSYSDSSDISDYAKDAVIWNSKHGIMIGNEDNTFSPVSNTTRAQAAAVFERIVKNLK